MQTATSMESVWAYLESLCLSDANRQWLADRLVQSIKPKAASQSPTTKPANPSPSGDPWFDDPENIAIVMEGIADRKAGRMQAYTLEEIREMLGL